MNKVIKFPTDTLLIPAVYYVAESSDVIYYMRANTPISKAYLADQAFGTRHSLLYAIPVPHCNVTDPVLIGKIIDNYDDQKEILNLTAVEVSLND